jgi:hypothetical protein
MDLIMDVWSVLLPVEQRPYFPRGV